MGDGGYLDGDVYLYLTDRSDFMIISGGVNIYPQESENLLITHPKVMDCAVFGVPDEEMGAVSYTHLRAHETVLDLVCRLLLETKNTTHTHTHNTQHNKYQHHTT